MLRYSWFYDHFHRSQPETGEQMEQYAQGFLIYFLDTTLFVNRWNTVGLYLLSALVVLATLYGYMSSSSRKKWNMVGGYWRAWESLGGMSCTFTFNFCCKLCFLLCIFYLYLCLQLVDLQTVLFLQLWVYAYFPTLALISRDEVAVVVPDSRLYDDRCYPCCRSVTTFVYYRRFFDIVTVVMPAETRDEYANSWDSSQLRILLEGPFCRTYLDNPIVPTAPPPSTRTTDSLPVKAIVTFMVGQDADLFCRVGDYTAFIRTHLMPSLTKVHVGGAADVPAT
ncbi:hypothetical protein CsSME_00051370 [Camellia sinensis var. sinensis]